VEQKNGAVVRKAVGCVRLEGVQAYHQLREAYRALRLVVNCFQPSLKLRARVSKGERVRRVYGVARTQLERLLASGVLSETRQEDVRARVQQIDPLALSEQLDALRYALWCGAYLPSAMEASRPHLSFSLAVCTPGSAPASQAEPEPTEPQQNVLKRGEILNWPRTTHDPFAGFWEEILALLQAHPEWTSTQIVQGIGHQIASQVVSAPLSTLLHRLTHLRRHLRASWEEPWPTELIQGGISDALLKRPQEADQAGSAPDQLPALRSVVRGSPSGYSCARCT
jgi:hypothetical protein